MRECGLCNQEMVWDYGFEDWFCLNCDADEFAPDDDDEDESTYGNTIYFGLDDDDESGHSNIAASGHGSGHPG